LPNVLVTPHTGGVYDGYIEDSLKIIEANVRYFLEGKQGDMINIVKRSQ
jgi:phosphoglycerate dehydrogenase-like enzyme